MSRAAERRARVAALLVVLALAAACGTTVPLHNGQPVALNSEGELVVLDDGMNAGLGLSPGSAGPADPGVAGGAGDGVAVAGGSTVAGGGGGQTSTAPATSSAGGGGQPGTSPATSGGGGNGAPRPSGGASAPGVSTETIKLGLEYVGDATAANAAIGANVSGGDGKANYEALAKYYNDHGGIDGRKIEPVYFEYSATRDIPQQQQTACAHFTQDQRVFAVLVIDASDQYVNCLAQNGVAAWGYEPMTGADEDMLAQFPDFMMPSALPVSAVARVVPPGLRSAGYFEPEAVDGSTRLGLVTFDEPRYRKAVKAGFLPGMQRVGETVDDVRYVHYAQSTNEVGQLSADISSVVLAFRQQNIDHVMFIEESALIAFTFLQQAERQGYHPQYGFNSTSGGQTFIDSGLAPAGQMTNSRLVAWQPQFDLPSRYVDPWPAQQLCLRIYEKAGIQFADGNSRGVAILHCAGFSFLKAALETAPGPLTIASVRAGGERLGESWSSPWIDRTKFGPGRHYGSAYYLTAAHDTGCNCFKPNGPLRPIDG